jgi:predicted ATPase/class 3 adenylate cyclase/uncharacterized protein HemY
MTNPPTGTVTFLFTDIEGSTKRWEGEHDAMRSALRQHDAILREAIEREGGYVFKTMGDAFCAAFDTPLSALRAVEKAQCTLNNELSDVKVRMALHTGMAEERDGDYFGPTLNRVARLLSAANGGQVLLSQPTYDLVRDMLPSGVTLLDMGEHRLKDLIRPEYIFQVVMQGLPADFPALRTIDAHPNNLPLQPTPFIGREKQVAAVMQLLSRQDVRLLTLTGPGGTGKTRLALQVAAELVDHFQDGIYFVDLAPLTNPALVVSEIAQALGVRESAGMPLSDSVKEYLKTRDICLLLDNFEHLTGAAGLVGQLLQAAAGLKILVTSRVPLHIRGEKEYAVSPLQLPDTTHLPPLGQLTQYEAVQLFIERAKDVKADFSVDNDNAPSVAEICTRLDGLPLAIELAAARVKFLSPQAILSRLQSRLKLLTGGARDAHSRQFTLRNTIAWSHDLLSEEEQKLFRRLAVFQGGRSIEAIEAVCHVSANSDADLQIDLLDGISSLIDKSLLRQEESAGGEPRFVMLETIHEFAREKLEESGEADNLRRQHAQFFLALAEQVEGELRGPRQVDYLDLLDIEHPNLRAALSWALENDLDAGLRLFGALVPFWFDRGHWSEGKKWWDLARSKTEVGEASSARPQISAAAHAKALYAAVRILLRADQESWRLCHPYLDESLKLYRQLGDKAGIAKVLMLLGLISIVEGDDASAHSVAEEALQLYQQIGDNAGLAIAYYRFGQLFTRQCDFRSAYREFRASETYYRRAGDKSTLAYTLNELGVVALYMGNYPTGEQLLAEAVDLLREIRDPFGVAMLLSSLGEALAYQGQYAKARSILEESLRVAREAGVDKILLTGILSDLGYVARGQGEYEAAQDHYNEALQIDREDLPNGSHLSGLGHLALHRGDLEDARLSFARGLQLARRTRYYPMGVECLAGLVSAVLARGDVERTTTLAGAVTSQLERMGMVLFPLDRTVFERDLNTARAHLEAATFQTAWDEGQTMTIEQAIAYALEDTSDA